MLKNKTSVLFVNNSGKDRETIQIPTTILLNWRKYIVVILIIFGFLTSLIVFFIYDYTNEYYSTLYKEKLARTNKIKNEIDIQKAKKSFQSIDESMFRINMFLEERGLKRLEFENLGGPLDFEITEINEVTDLYSDSILKLEDLIKNTPIGKPYLGDISSVFGTRRNPFSGISLEKHKGIDFKGDIGTPVKSTASGKVIFSGLRGSYGNCIIIQHNNDLKTLYAHLSELNVNVGEKIILGQIIGKIGSTGRSTGPHLHYEIFLHDKKINPENFINF